MSRADGWLPMLRRSRDPSGRREVWLREGDGALELCAGREGDDHYVQIQAGTAPTEGEIAELAAILSYDPGMGVGESDRVLQLEEALRGLREEAGWAVTDPRVEELVDAALGAPPEERRAAKAEEVTP